MPFRPPPPSVTVSRGLGTAGGDVAFSYSLLWGDPVMAGAFIVPHQTPG